MMPVSLCDSDFDGDVVILDTEINCSYVTHNEKQVTYKTEAEFYPVQISEHGGTMQTAAMDPLSFDYNVADHWEEANAGIANMDFDDDVLILDEIQFNNVSHNKTQDTFKTETESYSVEVSKYEKNVETAEVDPLLFDDDVVILDDEIKCNYVEDKRQDAFKTETESYPVEVSEDGCTMQTAEVDPLSFDDSIAVNWEETNEGIVNNMKYLSLTKITLSYVLKMDFYKFINDSIRQ